MGFSEVINPLFIEDTEVYKQFGPEAAAVLDRCYFIGGLPRPDIGISEKKLEELKKISIDVDPEAVKNVLRRYKTGELSGDSFIYEFSRALVVEDSAASKVFDKIFPEFKQLKPVSSNITLRSHMTSGWFLTLEALYKECEMPIKLFSIDRCFRREQSEDRAHLRTYHSASSVVLSDDISLDYGEVIAESLLRGFGFKDFKFNQDEKRSKYYAPDTQMEVFALTPSNKWLEIATYGMYSPVALSRYGIEHPVLNLGLGVERLAMILSKTEDIRELAYPQLYREPSLSDEELSREISYYRRPTTSDGQKIAAEIVKTAKEKGREKSPCSFEVYRGSILEKKAKVSLVEIEEKTRLLGPAALNSVFVYKGNIYGISKTKGPREVLNKGVFTGITYIGALANLAAWEIEKAAKDNLKDVKIQVKGVKLPSDINLQVSQMAVRYINSNNKKIDIRGPVFTTVEAELD